MAYTPLEWVDEIAGEDPVTYDIAGLDPAKTITMHVAPTAGTPVNATNLNHIEQGIADAPTLTNRQGGSATNWDTAGTTNYVPGDAKMQCGSVNTGATAEVVVTFPVAFAYKPLVFFHVVAAPATWLIAVVTAGGITIYSEDMAESPRANVDVNWMAVGSSA